MPVKPVRGQMILFQGEPDMVKTIVMDQGRYLVPRRDGHVLCGSTLEHVGFDHATTGEAYASLRDDAIRFCEEARRLRPEMTFGADIIAGFPTETEAMFENSLRLVEECGLTWLHVFPYSPRRGTPAARMPQVDGNAIRDRAARLRAAGELAVIRPVIFLSTTQWSALNMLS